MRLFSVVALSAAATWFFWVGAVYIVPGGANMFFVWADQLFTHGTLSPELAQRDVGFPLLIWLGGLGATGSFRGIALLYAVFGALMPPLVYLTLAPFSRWAAWFAGLAAIASCGPWIFGKIMYPDQACVFFSTLALCFLARHLAYGRPVALYLFTAAALFLSITRPAMNAVFPCLMLVAIVFGPRTPAKTASRGRPVRGVSPSRPVPDAARKNFRHSVWLHYGICLAVFAAALVGYHQYRARVFDVARLGYTPSYTGEQVFYDPYVNSTDFGIVLGPQLGPAMGIVQQRLIAALTPSPQQSKLVTDLAAINPPDFARDNLLLATVDEAMFRIWHQPNYEYAMLIDEAVDDATLLAAAGEIARAHPLYIGAYVIRNAWHFIFEPGFAHTRGNTHGYSSTGLDLFPTGSDLGEIDRFQAADIALAKQGSDYPNAMAALAHAWRWGYWGFIFATSFLMVAGWAVVFAVPFLFTRAFVGAFLAATGLLLYNALIVSAFADPDIRYEAMVLVLRAAVAGFAILAARPRWRLS